MRPSNNVARQQLLTQLRRGPSGATALAEALEVSPRTILRLIEELGTRSVAAGSTGRRRYALRRGLRGKEEAIPVFAVDTRGKTVAAGMLDLIEPGGALFDLTALGWPIDVAARDGWWRGLPYPLYDMRPQGFLGRAFARTEHSALEVSADPRHWGDDDIVHVLARHGADTSGNLILGEGAVRLFQRTLVDDQAALPAERTAAAYSRLADEIVAHGTVGSSAAGEFPKFTATRDRRGAATPHVIVKFSGADRGAATVRWSDLLICEHLALDHVSRLPVARAAATRVVQASGRTFLEAERFDRHGAHGRSPVLSLEVLNGHFLGLASQDWRDHAAALGKRGLLAQADVATISRLWWFGRLIANSDMHLGNLSFVPHAGRFTCAPAYDMLPMAYAPLAGGEVPRREWTFEMPLPAEAVAWQAAASSALAFWRDAADDRRISASFQTIARRSAEAIERLAAKV